MDDQNNQNNIDKDDKLSQCERERDEYLNGWKRAKADLINAKKEWEERIKNIGNYVKMDVISSLLPVLDALDGAKDVEGWRETQKLVVDILAKMGVEEIEAAGQEFNPEWHESVGETEGPERKIVEVVQKGYKIGENVIRPARVIIGAENSKFQIPNSK